jgi:hypothetical protein
LTTIALIKKPAQLSGFFVGGSRLTQKFNSLGFKPQAIEKYIIEIAGEKVLLYAELLLMFKLVGNFIRSSLNRGLI